MSTVSKARLLGQNVSQFGSHRLKGPVPLVLSPVQGTARTFWAWDGRFRAAECLVEILELCMERASVLQREIRRNRGSPVPVPVLITLWSFQPNRSFSEGAD
ncbi:hypothetical protein ATANTOWER_021206 [Ataeniobius toweri]|uniref:Uncharacterized protein n=1 Tax=Ataeniobius toweri TaxID=208326 RepID=A0ABU7A882_9TELE|nr:hypothetical protein [Ataeniobius toweri]